MILRWNSGSWSGLWWFPHGWPPANPSPLFLLKSPFVPATQDASLFLVCDRTHQSLWGRMSSSLKDSSALHLVNSYLTFHCYFECLLFMGGFSPFSFPRLLSTSSCVPAARLASVAAFPLCECCLCAALSPARAWVPIRHEPRTIPRLVWMLTFTESSTAC